MQSLSILTTVRKFILDQIQKKKSFQSPMEGQPSRTVIVSICYAMMMRHQWVQMKFKVKIWLVLMKLSIMHLHLHDSLRCKMKLWVMIMKLLMKILNLMMMHLQVWMLMRFCWMVHLLRLLHLQELQKMHFYRKVHLLARNFLWFPAATSICRALNTCSCCLSAQSIQMRCRIKFCIILLEFALQVACRPKHGKKWKCPIVHRNLCKILHLIARLIWLVHLVMMKSLLAKLAMIFQLWNLGMRTILVYIMRGLALMGPLQPIVLHLLQQPMIQQPQLLHLWQPIILQLLQLKIPHLQLLHLWQPTIRAVRRRAFPLQEKFRRRQARSPVRCWLRWAALARSTARAFCKATWCSIPLPLSSPPMTGSIYCPRPSWLRRLQSTLAMAS